VVRHGQAVRLHRMVVAVVRRADVRVVEVRDAILGGSHPARAAAGQRPLRGLQGAGSSRLALSGSTPWARGRGECKMLVVRNFFGVATSELLRELPPILLHAVERGIMRIAVILKW